MSKGKVILLVGVLTAGLLLFALLRDKASPARSGPRDDLASEPPKPQEPAQPARLEPAAPSPVSDQDATSPIPAPRSSGLEASETSGRDQDGRHVPGEGLKALQMLLVDPDFVRASMMPGDMETHALESLVDRAGLVLGVAMREAADERVAAGLYQRLSGYVPGEQFTPPRHDDRVLCQWLLTDRGEALQVDLVREEYPDFYALSDGIERLRAEQHSRTAKKAAK